MPAKIIKKWKQNGILLTKIKNNPKIQSISNERSDLFCVYHRWLQSVERRKTKIENDFHNLVDNWKQSSSSLIVNDGDKKEQEIILNYFHAIIYVISSRPKKVTLI